MPGTGVEYTPPTCMIVRLEMGHAKVIMQSYSIPEVIEHDEEEW